MFNRDYGMKQMKFYSQKLRVGYCAPLEERRGRPLEAVLDPKYRLQSS